MATHGHNIPVHNTRVFSVKTFRLLIAPEARVSSIGESGAGRLQEEALYLSSFDHDGKVRAQDIKVAGGGDVDWRPNTHSKLAGLMRYNG